MSESGVRERFPNLTPAGVSNFRPMPGQEPVQVAGPFSEFWAKGTGESKIGSRSLKSFPSWSRQTPLTAN